MEKVQRIDDKLRQLDKPALALATKLSLHNEDVLIVAAGFEDRSVEVVKRLVSGGIRGITVIILTYLPYLNENRKDEIEKICNEGKFKSICIEYDRHNPAGIGDRFSYILQGITSNIFIDISAMSRLLITQLIVFFGRQDFFRKMVILYSEALHYPPSKNEVEVALKGQKNDEVYRAMFLSSGVFEVTIVPELSSVALQGQPIRLVLFPSFNMDQLPSLRSEIQPACFSIINGVPPLVENKWRTEAIKKLNHIDEILNREEFNVSTLDYRETLSALSEIYNQHGDFERIIIAPVGSKMQAVAVGIFRTFMSDVQVAYPTPCKFAPPNNYTKEIRNIYELPLESFGTIK